MMENVENIYRETAWIFDIEHSLTEHGVTANDIPFYLEYSGYDKSPSGGGEIILIARGSEEG